MSEPSTHGDILVVYILSASRLWANRDEALDGLFTFVSSGLTRAIIDVKSKWDSI